MTAAPAAASHTPYCIQSGLLYMNDCSGPTTPLPCMWNMMPAAASTPPASVTPRHIIIV